MQKNKKKNKKEIVETSRAVPRFIYLRCVSPAGF